MPDNIPAKPIRRNLTIYQGASLHDTRVWKLAAPGAPASSAVPVDLTGCTARAQIRSDLDSGTVLLELSTTNGSIVLGDEDGSVTFVLSAAETAAISWESGVYDMELTFPDGFVRRLFYGDVTVSREVTRDAP